MTNNASHGTYRESRATTMQHYDALPPDLREIVRNCFANWATGIVRSNVKTYGLAPAADQLIRDDARYVSRTVKKDWKAQAAAYLAVQKPRRRRDWLDKPPCSRL